LQPSVFLQGFGDYLGSAVPVYCARGIPTLNELAKATDFPLPQSMAGGMRAEYFASTDLTGPPLLIAPNRTSTSAERRPRYCLTIHSSDRFTGYYSPARSGLYDVFVESSGEDGGFTVSMLTATRLWTDWTVNTALMDSISLQFEATSHKMFWSTMAVLHWLGRKLRLGTSRMIDVIDQEAKLLAAEADVVIVAVGF